MRTSPPGSSTTSPRTMIPPHNPFASAPAPTHSTTLAAPNQPSIGSRSPGYSSHSYSHSTSPSTGSGSLPEIQNHDPSMMMISPTQISSASLNAQKRAYRQRRKDPSCDACRERKVKCDATETSACSECSSRNHKCQFTKETNRRMSSIKQVQDLQSQIAQLTQQNIHLAKATGVESTDYERAEPKRRHSEAQVGMPPTPQRITAPAMRNFEHVRDNIREQSRDIFITSHTPTTVIRETGALLHEVPPRSDFARLSRAYLDSIHEWYPALHWPTFQNEVDEMYTATAFEGKAQEWIGLFFAVLACGTLHGPADYSANGTMYFELATKSLTPWSQDLAMEHAQAALLLSIFATERNMKTVGSMWLGSATRAAQELNLHCAVSTGSVIDIETRRRLWWAIYTRDRITSLDSHRPMLINEDDCDTPLPSPIEDRYIQSQGYTRSHAVSPPFTGFLAVVQMTRLYAPLYQALKFSTIGPKTLKSFDDDFRTKFPLLPESHRMDYSGPLDATAFPPLFSLLSAQFHLYRRNLTPACRLPGPRAEAMSRCIAVAQETAKYISRTLYSPTRSDTEKNWHTRVALVASNMMCLHLWRCMLVLCFRGDYDAAFMCLHVSTAIGKSRSINSACGKHLVFFLGELLGRVRSGHGSPQQLEHDEEMLAYVSGDAQGSVEHSWVWTDNNMTSSPPSQSSSFDTTRSRGGDEPMRDVLPLRTADCSSKQSAAEWDDWIGIEHMIRQLMEENRPRTATYYPPPHNPMKRVQLAHEAKLAPKPPPPSSPAPSSSSRISIANII